jgi:nitrous oxidase accessory protein NosD
MHRCGKLCCSHKDHVGYGGSNLIYNNAVIDGEGIELLAVNMPAKGHSIFNNTVQNCSIGIRVSAAGGNNTFHANNIIENDVGIRLGNAGENTTCFHNNFVNNKVQFSLISFKDTDILTMAKKATTGAITPAMIPTKMR